MNFFGKQTTKVHESITSSLIMKTDLSYLGKDPGAVKFGNFINYYSFHSAKERINNLNHDMFPKPKLNKPYICLDIGCNTGDLTNELFTYLKTLYPETEISILGIDIDEILIQRAKEENDTSNVSFLCLNIMSDTDRVELAKYLEKFNKQIFDVIFCFSVTMWIHINSGDDGLVSFLEYITSISLSIVIEPQPWNCYRNAQRRLKKSGDNFPLYEKLKFRSNVDTIIKGYIEEKNYTKIYESSKSSWKRTVLSYHYNSL